jgi:hypothetical protein
MYEFKTGFWLRASQGKDMLDLGINHEKERSTTTCKNAI